MSTYSEAVQWGADPCQSDRCPDPASGAGSASSPPAPSGSYRSSPLAGDSTQPIKKEGNKMKTLWQQ